MKLLLDTHIFLWYISKDSRLPNAMLEAIRNPDNEVFLSVVSVWETIIKYQIGKLRLPQNPETYLPIQRKRHSISSLVLDESTVCHLSKLPSIHRDPFDRILICQAIEHGLTIATVDNAIKSYAVKTLK
ncbi:MAG: type II toxin-antitoxin system VapC family toxin [Desulfobacterales bacterium]